MTPRTAIKAKLAKLKDDGMSVDNLRVMEHDADGNGLDIGSVDEIFGNDFLGFTAGDAQGGCDQRGCEEWWPLYNGDALIGELRDGANGLMIHIESGPVE